MLCRDRQRVNPQHLPGVVDLIRVKQEGPGLHQTAIVHLPGGNRTVALRQHVAPVRDRAHDGERQCIHTQHLALIDQRGGVQRDGFPLQRAIFMLFDVIRCDRQRVAGADPPCILQLTSERELQSVRPDDAPPVIEIGCRDTQRTTAQRTGIVKAVAERQRQRIDTGDVAVVKQVIHRHRDRIAQHRPLIG